TDKGVSVLEQGDLSKGVTKNYFSGVSVTCIYEDPKSGTFWFATHGAGLKRFKDGKFNSFTTAEGMTTNFIYRFFEDQEGNFWFMSDSGILRGRKQELNQRADGGTEPVNCVSFGISDGMKSPEFNNNFSRSSALKDKQGKLWFVTKKGISIVDPGNLQINRFPPPVVIEAVTFNGQTVSTHALPSEENRSFKGITELEFKFTAPTFLSPEKIRFKYQLEGADSDWVFLAPGSERVATYKNLGPGTYLFKVTACNSEGIWNRNGDTLSFTLEPSFYETWVFKGLVVLLLIGLAVAGFYFYSRYARAKAEAEARG
ncbi:MAG: hypothetical protein GY940_18730, partial [bacterium]|nr:hypothetical protein [bacterium]